MTSQLDNSLAAQCQELRGQLLAQRQIIERQLEPDTDRGFPRSMTMRFLKNRSISATKVIAGFTALLLALRFSKTMTTTLGIIKAVRTVAGNRK